MIDKKTLSERDICTKFITPSLQKAGWNTMTQFLEEVSFSVCTALETHIGESVRANELLLQQVLREALGD